MKIILFVMVFLFTSTVILLAYGIIWNKKVLMKQRLDYIKDISDDMEENIFKEPFAKRVIIPSYEKLIKTIGNAAPKAIRKKYQALIFTSGTTKQTTVNSIFVAQIITGIVFAGSIYGGFRITNHKVNILVMIFFGAAGFILPLYSLYSKSSKRKEKIRRSLPDLLDLLYVSVEAGMGFDMALKKSAEKMKGPLSEEVLKTLNEIARGKGREEAMRMMVQRSGVDDLGNFVIAIIQTEQLGSSISNMLKIQSHVLRQKRRQRAEQQAAKISLKMLFPLIFLMLPALFIVILGPAMISIFNSILSNSY